MTVSAITMLYRSLARHRLFAVLNIGGLALGIAVFLVLFLFVRFETGYDRVLPGWDKLWLVSEQYTRPGDPSDANYYTMAGELDQLRGDFPDLVGTRWWNNGTTVLQGAHATAEDLEVVDPDYFRLFPFRTLEGNPTRTLADPNGLVITAKIAKKYFGDQSAVGQTLTLALGPKTYAYRVGAVLADMPNDMTYKGDLYAPLVRARFDEPFFDHWGSTALTTFLRFPDAAAARAFEARLPGFLGRHAYPGGNMTRETYHQFLEPLSAMHLIEPADRAIVTTLGVVGTLTLLIAIVNYINLATARAGLRAREVAMRKVLGGTRGALIAQFMGEAIVTVALAALIGLALAELALPLVNAAGGTTLVIRYWGMGGVLLPLVLMVLIVGAVAGFYPAIILSGFKPAAVLASTRSPGGGRSGSRLRSALVVLQFSIAIAFAISTAVMIGQTAHIAKADVGFRRDGLIVVRSFTDPALDAAQRTGILDAFRRQPGITSVGYGLNAPGDQNSTNTSTLHRAEAPQQEFNTSVVTAGPGYFDAVGTRLIAGRLFDDAHAEDDRGRMTDKEKQRSTPNIVLNEVATRTLGFNSPAIAIGQTINGINGDGSSAHVIGVVADQRFRSPRESIYPTAFTYTTGFFDDAFALVRFSGGDAPATIARLEAAWKRIAPQVPFDARSAEDNLYARYYKTDTQRARLFTIGAVLAIVIGCIGLYGLAAFDTARRVREIGIRKTLGASTRDILRLLIGQFMRPVLLANLIAWPVAFVAMRRWLAGFDDRVAMNPAFFLGASLIAVAIATLTILGQSWRVARAEPARALRDE